MKSNSIMNRRHACFARAGNASIDYVLVICIILPLAVFLFAVVPRMIQLVYDMTIVFVSSPFA